MSWMMKHVESLLEQADKQAARQLGNEDASSSEEDATTSSSSPTMQPQLTKKQQQRHRQRQRQQLKKLQQAQQATAAQTAPDMARDAASEAAQLQLPTAVPHADGAAAQAHEQAAPADPESEPEAKAEAATEMEMEGQAQTEYSDSGAAEASTDATDEPEADSATAADAAAEAAQLRQRVYELGTALAAAKGSAEVLSHDKAALEEALHAQAGVRRQESMRVAELEGAVAEYSKVLAVAHRDAESRAAEAEARAAEATDFQRRLRTSEDELASYKAKASLALRDQEAQLAQLRTLVEETERSRASLEERCNQQDERHSLQLAQLDRDHDAVRDADAVNGAAECERLRKRVLQLEADTLRLQTQLAAAAVESARWHGDYDRERVRATDLETRFDALKRQSAAKALAKAHSPTKQLQQAEADTPADVAAALQAQIADLTSQLRLAVEENQRLRSMVARLEAAQQDAAGVGGRVAINVGSIKGAPYIDAGGSLAYWVRRGEQTCATLGLVEGAAGAFDAVSSYLVRLLRRHPFFRLLALLYFALLHCWLFLLFAQWGPAVNPDGVGKEGPN
eukprot:TRINITY_DN15065_c0_g2_i1.p1 TRINITY_DN15065_c0_g2~~TRINITY_DN15065_c0_g2_i1.p1  ORF type:complete len:568 (-),score=197.38 TRINITY_DN15065_c0_g2_i1:51-1754(-)